ncbi:carboxylate/amino acid/amine transporter [Legionella massiliensis]|uniref:Carboxylate/amino acid/amine transporter n=1 Tax=Legionella massiliensis TaxID=1034943 RepID=A0A078KX45_9GAMM|nr:DMT family transporter [Legionella massiliensis]CDZ77612.1 carboxylate/amino acid/amine transporter [Legionella massiliensis]CEE13350.1 EamA-like transporter family protein [Legionella massiliensis]
MSNQSLTAELTDKTPQNIRLGVMLAFGASLFYSVMGALVKLVADDTSNTTIIFFRFALGFLVLLPIISIEQGHRRPLSFFKTRRPFLHLIRAISGLLSLLLLYYSLKYVPLVDAVLLNTTYPIFVPIVLWMLIGAKTTAKSSIGILIGFIGIALVLRPNEGLFNSASLIALASGVAAAFAIACTRLLSKTESPDVISFYYFLLTTLISLILILFSWNTPDLKTLLILVVIAIVATAYQLCLTQALARTQARIVSPIMYSAIIFSGILGWCIWGVIPDLLSVAGTILVFTGALIAVSAQNRTQ